MQIKSMLLSHLLLFFFGKKNTFIEKKYLVENLILLPMMTIAFIIVKVA